MNFRARTSSGTVPCRVECLPAGPWLVRFRNGKTLFLQLDYDQAAFAVNCGAIKPASNWNGLPQSLGPDWNELDPEAIEHAPDVYLTVAQ